MNINQILNKSDVTNSSQKLWGSFYCIRVNKVNWTAFHNRLRQGT